MGLKVMHSMTEQEFVNDSNGAAADSQGEDISPSLLVPVSKPAEQVRQTFCSFYGIRTITVTSYSMNSSHEPALKA